MNEIIYGIHTVNTLLETEPNRFIEVFLLKGRTDLRLKLLVHNLEKIGIVAQIVSRQWLDEKAKGCVHQGVLARVKKGRQFQENYLVELLATKREPFLLILDGVTDPHNLGACLRCADATNVHAVIMSRDHSAPLNATAKKVASGAAETVPLIRVTNLARALLLIRKHNVWIIGTDSKTERHLYESKLTGSLALVIGSESRGIRHLTRRYCDELISIPMAGKLPSLNLSVATGVYLFEAFRQRLKTASNRGTR